MRSSVSLPLPFLFDLKGDCPNHPRGGIGRSNEFYSSLMGTFDHVLTKEPTLGGLVGNNIATNRINFDVIESRCR